MEKYNKEKNLNLEILTLCHPDNRGAIYNGHYKDLLLQVQSGNNKNSEHVKNNINLIKKSKSLAEMSPEEKYNHTLELIAGIDIISNSNICVLDYQSNISRFIKLFHKSPENVFDIQNPDSDWDYSIVDIPAYHGNFHKNM